MNLRVSAKAIRWMGALSARLRMKTWLEGMAGESSQVQSETCCL